MLKEKFSLKHQGILAEITSAEQVLIQCTTPSRTSKLKTKVATA